MQTSKMIARKVIPPILLVAVLVTGAYWLGSSSWRTLSDPALDPLPSSAQKQEARDSLPPSEEVASMPPSDAESVPALATPPQRAEVREQAMEAPQESPQVLLDFAHSLAGLMERALASEEAAIAGFGELESCVNDPSGKTSLQARLICLANAKRLSEQYSDALGARQRKLEEKNSRLAGMLEATGL